ncbi:MAG: hypothetical protein U1E23_07005 [Reyranellaceae bacterium]
MAEPHVVSALIAKRAELAGLMEHHQAKVRQLMIDLDAVDQALRLFKPDIELAEIKPKPMPPRHAAYKGEVARIVLGTLRDAKRPCTTQELTMHVMAERGMNTADKRLVKMVTKRVGASLRHHRAKGLIRSNTGISERICWEVA